MDDWCPSSGRIPKDRLDHIERVASGVQPHRGSARFKGSGCKQFQLGPHRGAFSRRHERKGIQHLAVAGKNGAQRTLVRRNGIELTLTDSRFVG